MKYTVKSWYDRKTKSWVTQILDEQGNQIGDSAYDGNKESRDASIREMNQRILTLRPNLSIDC